MSGRSIKRFSFFLFAFTLVHTNQAAAFDKEEFHQSFPNWELATNGVMFGLNIYLSTLPDPAPSFGPPEHGSLDYKLRENHENLDHEYFNALSDSFMYPLVIVPPVSYIAGRYLPKFGIETPELKFLAFLEAVNFTELFTIGTKKLVGRERPNGSDTESFISGHASSSFMGAAFFSWDASNLLERRIPSDTWIGYRAGARALPFVALYSAAGLVAYYRIAAEKHYFSDVVAGGITGALCGNIIYLYHFRADGTPRKTAPQKTQLYPIIESGYQGIQFVWQY